MPVSKKTRNVLFDIAGGTCIYCGENECIALDHVYPIAKGGNDLLNNFLPACTRCNSSKGNKTLDEYLSWRLEFAIRKEMDKAFQKIVNEIIPEEVKKYRGTIDRINQYHIKTINALGENYG